MNKSRNLSILLIYSCFCVAPILFISVQVKKVNIADFHPDFPLGQLDPHSLEDVQQYLQQRFVDERRDKEALLYHHFTTATDTENIKRVFEAVRSTILENNLKDLMLNWWPRLLSLPNSVGAIRAKCPGKPTLLAGQYLCVFFLCFPTYIHGSP